MLQTERAELDQKLSSASKVIAELSKLADQRTRISDLQNRIGV